MIDAEFRREEKYQRLSIAYTELEEEVLVGSTVDIILEKCEMEAETYITSIKNGKEVLVIEYHDCATRNCSLIFDEIIKTLNITEILQ